MPLHENRATLAPATAPAPRGCFLSFFGFEDMNTYGHIKGIYISLVAVSHNI